MCQLRATTTLTMYDQTDNVERTDASIGIPPPLSHTQSLSLSHTLALTFALSHTLALTLGRSHTLTLTLTLPLAHSRSDQGGRRREEGGREREVPCVVGGGSPMPPSVPLLSEDGTT